MKAILKPSCLEELFFLLDLHPGALPMAGGTDLLVRLRGEAAPDRLPLLSLAGVAELHGIREEGEALSIGAAMTFSRIMADRRIQERAPLLVSAARHIGGPAIRNMATIGGNVCTASPAGDSLPPLHLLDARVEIASRQGVRWLPIGEFIVGPGRTSLSVGEIVTRIVLLRQGGFPCQCFEKVGRRRSMAIAVASFAGMIRLAADGTPEEVRLAWGSVAPAVLRIPSLEEELAGSVLDSGTICRAARIIRDTVSPITDIRATADYRRMLAGNFAIRFLEGLRG